ncbi:calcium-activated potassium channel subunit beta-4 isoform X1 [Pipistrellus kuhlii]|uniref:calcium-activated potassium channel subunit beta-4 isoform X1 n=1 Tax=Pipistrellus kuhlii TaxID=59472 RepID=UPI001E26F8E6|nr:calcium-activated potassium channel subunit beta-4 isoform X1 [Pipistrellus kuhlii]
MAKLRVAYEYTEAEDKSIRLGLFLIISGVVSLFIFGFCWLSPALQDLQATAANCTVLSVQQLGELFECTFTCGADCRGTAQYPCVQVYVNNSESNARALLHSDEHQLLANPKCSYIPPCKRENQKNLESVMNWQQYWKDEIGSQPFTCYFNQFQSTRLSFILDKMGPGLAANGEWIVELLFSQPLESGKNLPVIHSNPKPDDVLLHRTHDEIVLLHCFLWPLVTFVVGVLIVALTICAKSLAVKAEALKKRKFS